MSGSSHDTTLRGNRHANMVDKHKHTFFEKISPLVAVISFFVAVSAAVGTVYQAYIANDSEVRSLRAYVAPKSVVFDPDSVRLEIDNVGQTPAVAVRVFSNWEPRPLNQRADFCRVFTFPERHQCPGGASAVYLLPHGPVNTGNLLCDAIRPDALNAENRRADLVLYGQISYRDIFGKRRVTTLCDFVGPDGGVYCDCHNELDPKQ